MEGNSEPPNADNNEVRDIDPCRLVLADDWAFWTEEAITDKSGPFVLEHGEACGWRTSADDLRLAIAVLPAEGTSHLLSDEERASAEGVPNIGDRAFWLAGWPVAQSSTLVVEIGDLDLVVEVSGRGGVMAERIRATAEYFATTIVFERLQ